MKSAKPMLSITGLASRPISKKSKVKIMTANESVLEVIPVRVIIFGSEDSGKTHLASTFPAPVIVIDTEGRYVLILKKFRTCKDCENSWATTDKKNKMTNEIIGGQICPICNSKNVTLKDIRGIRCRSSQDCIDAVDLALEELERHYQETGKLGTVVVDNVSRVWEWCKNEYVKDKRKRENLSEGADVRLDPRTDYAIINPRHNEEFRDKLIDSPFHIVLIAASKKTYNDETNHYKATGIAPEGQKFNANAVDMKIYLSQGSRILENGDEIGDGIFTAHISKNSLIAGDIEPIKNLNFKKIIEIRSLLFETCKMNEGIDVEKTEDEIKPDESMADENNSAIKKE